VNGQRRCPAPEFWLKSSRINAGKRAGRLKGSTILTTQIISARFSRI
jgi:hypothetical protein